MTRADQIGGEWLDLHPGPDTRDLTVADVARIFDVPLELFGRTDDPIDAVPAPADLLDRIDDLLVSYDASSQPEDRPWPYRSF